MRAELSVAHALSVGGEPRTHALLRISGRSALICDLPPPAWVRESLARAPWVVVRRARPREGLLPVGVRGSSRQERFAAWLAPRDVQASVTPRELAGRRGWRRAPRAREIPCLAALDDVEAVLHRHGLDACWGPTGSAGFELASGSATVTPASDLDLVVYLERSPPAELASSLHAELSLLAQRTDVWLEAPLGAMALAEYARGADPVLLRTADGPRLVARPRGWAMPDGDPVVPR